MQEIVVLSKGNEDWDSHSTSTGEIYSIHGLNINVHLVEQQKLILYMFVWSFTRKHYFLEDEKEDEDTNTSPRIS